MLKKITNFILILCILFISIIGLVNYQVILTSIINSSKIFLFNVFPYLLFMMTLNNILLNINTSYYLKNNLIYLFFMSILSGAPVNAIIIKDFLDKKIINERKASLLICPTLFNNPLFLYNFFNKIFSSNIIIIKLFIIIYLSNFIIFFLITKKIETKKIEYQNYKLKNVLNECFKKVTQNLLTIFITFTFFKLICDLFLSNNNILTTLFRGIIEVTQGLNSLINLNASVKIKELLTLIILNFGSFSIHMQISFILSDYNINYKYFYLIRIALMIISIVIILTI